jgi:chaperonin GroES
VAPTKKKKKKTAAPKAAPKKVMKKTSSKPAARPSSFKPLDDRLIVRVEPAAEKTAGGIIIPGTAGERPFRGKVMAKGPGRRSKKGLLRPLDVNVGDMVLFPQYAGQKIEIDAEEFLILREEEILAISIA